MRITVGIKVTFTTVNSLLYDIRNSRGFAGYQGNDGLEEAITPLGHCRVYGASRG